MDASGYLYTIATVGMTFAGLSVLTMILRQMLGGRITKWDSWVTRTWIELGFMTTFGSILPPLLILFGPRRRSLGVFQAASWLSFSGAGR